MEIASVIDSGGNTDGEGEQWQCFPLARYRMSFDVPKKAELPKWTGSMWRGALGHAFKAAVCVTGTTTCDSCQLHGSCAYAYIFETPLPPASDRMRRYTTVPHPYVLWSKPRANGRSEELEITLFGHANKHLSYLVHALTRAGARGLGRGKVPVNLTRVVQDMGAVTGEWENIQQPDGSLRPQAPSVPQIPGPPTGIALQTGITLQMLSPVRLQRDGQLVKPTAFRFSDLAMTLLRRLSMVSYFHGNGGLQVDFRDLRDAARAVEIASQDLRWHDQARYSSRQNAKVKMGGLLGRVRIEGTALLPFWPILWLGQWLHVGKGSSMGLGRYRIEPQVATPPTSTQLTSRLDTARFQRSMDQ